MKGRLVEESAFISRYPLLVYEQELNKENFCVFKPYYNHLNRLIDYDGQVQFEILNQPSSCRKKSAKNDLILFGIKSMPNSVENRKLLRDTWLGKGFLEILEFFIDSQPFVNLISQK